MTGSAPSPGVLIGRIVDGLRAGRAPDSERIAEAHAAIGWWRVRIALQVDSEERPPEEADRAREVLDRYEWALVASEVGDASGAMLEVAAAAIVSGIASQVESNGDGTATAYLTIPRLPSD